MSCQGFGQSPDHVVPGAALVLGSCNQLLNSGWSCATWCHRCEARSNLKHGSPALTVPSAHARRHSIPHRAAGWHIITGKHQPQCT